LDIETKYLTFWPRFWAGMADAVVLLPLSLLDRWLFGASLPRVALVAWFCIYSFSYVTYSVLMHGQYGQTLGKMLTGVKVLDLSESRLSLRQAFLRDSVLIAFTLAGIVFDMPKVLAGIPPWQELKPSVGFWILTYGSAVWFLAELGTMLTNEKRRAIHDFIAGSVVVRLAPRRSLDSLIRGDG